MRINAHSASGELIVIVWTQFVRQQRIWIRDIHARVHHRWAYADDSHGKFHKRQPDQRAGKYCDNRKDQPLHVTVLAAVMTGILMKGYRESSFSGFLKDSQKKTQADNLPTARRVLRRGAPRPPANHRAISG